MPHTHHLRGRRLPQVLGGALLALSASALAGCSGPEAALPVVGAPAPSPTTTVTEAPGRADQLRTQYQLTGIDLPSDWPDVPVPPGTSVSSAYAIDASPRRTWTASFVGSASKGAPTAEALASPVIKALEKAGYQPISAFTNPDEDAGLYGFEGPNYSVYLVLGDLDGQPNIVMTVRQRGSKQAGPTSSSLPSGTLPPLATQSAPTGPTAPSSPTVPPASTPTAPTPTVTAPTGAPGPAGPSALPSAGAPSASPGGP